MSSFMSGRIVQALSPRARGIRNRPAYFAALLFGMLFAVSCNDATGPTGDVFSVRFSLETQPNLVVGQTVQLFAVPLNAAGTPMTIVCRQSFSSNSPSIATVDQKGMVTAVSPGTAIITATLNNVPKTIPVVVVSGKTLTLSPQNAGVAVGATVPYTATLRDATGKVVSGTITFSSGNPAIATINPSTGVATGVAPGIVTIQAASADGLTATATLTVSSLPAATIVVTPPASTIGVGVIETLTATIRDAAGTILPNRFVVWQSSNNAIATVTNNGGNTTQVQGVSAGTVTITATSEGKSGTASVTVTGSGSGSISVSPTGVTVGVGATVQLTPAVRDAAGNPIAGAAVTFTSSDPTIASVSATGVVTGNASGTATITIAGGGMSITIPATITVAGTPVSTVTLTLPNPAVCVGKSTQLSAVVKDASGNILTGRNVTFTSNNNLVATVTAGGLLTGIAAGVVDITATSEGKSTTATATICLAASASLILAPASATLGVGVSTQLVATLRDDAGNIIAGRPVTFTSSNTSVATVDAAGNVTGVAAGTATITAVSDGKTSTSAITVVTTPVASIGLTPSSVTPCVGQSQQLTAVVRDASGNILTGRNVTFTSSAPAVATVNASGLVTGVTAGLATITATSEGKTTTAQANICLAVVATVALAPATATVGVGANVQLVATLIDNAGNIITGRPVTFTSSNTSVATVDAAGKVTGVAAGTATITAVSDGKTSTSAITVVPAPVASISLTPSTVTPCVGQSQQLTAVVRDASGNILTGRNVTFTSSAPAIAKVNASGLVTGVVAGLATITATSEGQTTTAQANICLAAVATVALSPATATVKAGATTTLVATVTDQAGNILTGRTVTFTSSNLLVATVAADGTVVGLLPGTATITATIDGKTSTSLITVIP
ncbi:MAG: Ig-like domain-containing protein [Gemmatimonadaceae bacterium]|nr:Ig-like domain-containing protein [Gemmatimonadaceae bacterium]